MSPRQSDCQRLMSWMMTAGAECGGEPEFIEQPVPGAPDPRVMPRLSLRLALLQ